MKKAYSAISYDPEMDIQREYRIPLLKVYIVISTKKEGNQSMNALLIIYR